MKVKYLTVASVLALSACATLIFAACDEEETAPHAHTYGMWTVETAQTLFTDGVEARVCTAADCDAADKGKETRAIAANGKTSAVKDAFTYCADGLTATENGVKLGMSEENCGASTYLGAEDKLTAFGDGGTTLSFTLDLSAFARGDYTVFVLSYGTPVAEGSASEHAGTEDRVGIKRTETGYTVAMLSGVNWDDLDSMGSAIDASEQKEEIVSASNKITFSYTYAYAGGTLTSSFAVDGEKAFDFPAFASEDIGGVRALWNAYATSGEAVLSNLVMA